MDENHIESGSYPKRLDRKDALQHPENTPLARAHGETIETLESEDCLPLGIPVSHAHASCSAELEERELTWVSLAMWFLFSWSI